jgi:glycosyltransferase involved in cell wall biosynthesis
MFSRHYLPGYKAGGPIRSLCGMVDILKYDYNLKVVTLNHDYGETEQYTNIESECWLKNANYDIFYGADTYFTLSNVKKIILKTQPNYIYLNSFFDVVFSIKVYLLLIFMRKYEIKLVIAPRGEFSSGALGFKRIQKKIFISIFRLVIYLLKPRWHASNMEEKLQILKMCPSVKRYDITVAVNIPNVDPKEDLKEIQPCSDSDPSTLKICFLSRISRMKNLKFALEVLQEVESNVEFTIFGPCEDIEYWHECTNVINDMRDNVKIVVAGEIEHSAVQIELKKYDVFFLPTLGENFGHVIFEALCAGLILVISDRTMWKNLSQKQLGWDLPLTNKATFGEKIDEVASRSRCEIEAGKVRCIRWSNEWLHQQNFDVEYKKLFL